MTFLFMNAGKNEKYVQSCSSTINFILWVDILALVIFSIVHTDNGLHLGMFKKKKCSFDHMCRSTPDLIFQPYLCDKLG